MTYRLRNIVVAVGLAVVAALLTTFYVANYKRHVQQNESTVTVYVAKRDVPAGTSGADLVKHGWLSQESVMQRTVVPGAISDPNQVRALITSQPIYSGEQVSLRRFADHTEQGVRAQLHGTLRALSLPGTPDQLLAGTLRTGDHVDVLADLKTGDCSTCFETRVVARDVPVLSAPNATTTGKLNSGSSTQSVMLAVGDSREEQRIYFAVENGAGWTLALRPVANASDSSEDVEGIQSMETSGVSAATLARAGGTK
jgi:Flp pilus assembly protein CpaB